ncbi:MAG: antitoxin Xre-like helix-turn-helix domain-containing protein [Polyangiales bacterium]
MSLATAQIATDEAAVVSKALFRAAELWGISSAELAEIIGTSESTLSRIRTGKRGPIPLGSKEGELALLFLRVFRSLDALVGGDEAHAKAWLRAQNHHVGGIPLRRMKKVEGLVDVAEYLDAMRGTI